MFLLNWTPDLRGRRFGEPSPRRPGHELGGDEGEVLPADEDGEREETPERQRVRLSKRGEHIRVVSLQGVPNDGQDKLPLPLQVNVVLIIGSRCYMVFGYKVFSAIWSILGWSQ